MEAPAGSGNPGTFAPAPTGSPLVLARTGASTTIAATRIFVRLASTTTVAGSPYSGNITHSTAGATAVTKAVTGTVTAPVAAPTISGFTPGNGPVGTSVTISGTNFTGTTAVAFNGTAAPGYTVGGGGTQITVTVPAGATTGTITVTTPGGTATSATSFVVDPTPNPVPTISSLNPTSTTAGSPDFSLTVDGTGFLAGSSVSFNGTPRVTSFASTTRLTVAILAADVATAGTYNVTVTNPAPGGGTSAPATFTVIAAPTGTPCLTQGFNTLPFPPAGWAATGVSRSTTAADVKTGAGAVIFNSEDGQLATPVLSNPTALQFSLGRTTNSTPKTLTVEVSTTSQTAGFTTIATYNHSNVPAGSYDEYTVDLSAYASAPQVWIRFVKTSTTTSPWRFDEVKVFCGPASTNPFITSITPTSGPTGTVVTITGGNFSTTNVTGVLFGTTSASAFDVVSATEIRATVALGTPAGAQTVSLTDGTTPVSGPAFTVVATPTITASVASLTGFTTTQGTPSSTRTYTVSGNGLGNAGIVISTPAGFEVATASGGPYTSALTLPTNAAGNVATTTIYVRLTGVNQGTFTGNLDNNSASVTAAVQISLSGTVNPGPGLLATPTALTGFTATVGQNSAAQSYQLTGSGLTNNVVVTAPIGYEVATAAGGTYTSALTVVRSGGNVSQTIFVRLRNTIAAGTYDARSVSNVSGGFAVAVDVSGVVNAPATLAQEPTTVGDITFGAITSTSIRVNVTAGDGTGRLLVVRQAAPITADPIDGIGYTASSAYSAGTEIGSQNYVVLSGTAPGVTVTGLTPGVTYFFRLYEYNGTGSNSNYLTGTTASNSATTTAAVATTGPGELYMEEGFDYPLGTTLTSTGNWQALNSNTTNAVQTNNLSLSATQYGTPSLGTAATLDADGQDVRRTFSPALTAGTLYTSFLVNVGANGIGNDNDYYFSLSGSADGAYRGRVHFRASTSGPGYNVGVSFGGSTGTDATRIKYAEDGSGPIAYAYGQTYTVVIRYTRKPGTSDDEVRLYVLDQNTPVVEPTVPQVADFPITFNTTSTTEETITSVVLRQNNGTQNITIDGIRVGSGWGAVVGRPRFVDEQFALRAGNYYDVEVNLPSATSSIAALGMVNIESGLILTQGVLQTTSTNLLMLRASASVTPPTPTIAATSFVDGPLAWEYDGTTNRTFPIGKDGIARPFTLNISQTGTAVYQMEVIKAPSPDYGLPANITRRSAVRYFTLNRLSGTAAITAAQVTLTYGTDDGVDDPAFLRVLRSENAAPYEDKGQNSGGTGNPTGSITSDAFTADFNLQNVFTLGNQTPGTNPLPVELISFTAVRQSEAVRVAWATASEKDNAQFEVQRSANGKEFHTIATVEGHGTTARRHDYSVLDRQPLAGLAYYRLRQLDTDGKASFSPVVTVAPGKELAVYPNPTRSELTLVAAAPAASYRIISMVGSVVQQGQAPTGTATLDVSKLPAGLYQLEVTSAAGRAIRKFTKLD